MLIKTSKCTRKRLEKRLYSLPERPSMSASAAVDKSLPLIVMSNFDSVIGEQESVFDNAKYSLL